ncbi:MAG: ATP-binding protein [Symploca sp. SIO2C1]|nr:ATP-binding protein [Symploca sp. SIO2C1]
MNRKLGYSYLLHASALSDNHKGAIFGLQIPFIPDFLCDHTLLGKEPSERIREYSRRWTQFVSELWRHTEDVTYALRFDLDQASRGINVFLLGRLQTPDNENTIAQARILLSDLERLLKSFGFEPDLMTVEQLQLIIQKLDYSYCFEVCQEEVGTPIRTDTPIIGIKSRSPQDDGFSIPSEFIYPQQNRQFIEFYGIRYWWGAGGTFLLPFNALASQSNPASVSILLRPTSLTYHEQHLMAEVARQTESLAQRQTSENWGNLPSQNKTDPNLRWESRLYAANLRRLNHPFLVTVLCFSNQVSAAQQVASAIASTIREEQAYEPPLGEAGMISSGAKIHYLGNKSYVQKAAQYLTFEPLLIHDFHNQEAPHRTLTRLRYLMDGRGATSAFRFPISVQGGVPGISVKQRPPDFHPGARNEVTPDKAIDLGRFHVGGRAFVALKDFTKHALITGFTGSGKTNTVLYLLYQFWEKGIPFLVIESAKKEYRGLRYVEKFKYHLRIYTLGNETVFSLRFNPFQLIPGVRVEAHIAKLQTCFDAALPPAGPLPSIIIEALDQLYRQKGWKLTDTAKINESRSFPRMQDFYQIIEKVVADRQYSGEIKNNVEAAVKGRIKPLTFGSKGLMFSQEISNPSAELLFSNPVILELNDLNEMDKSLVMMFFLTLLREYRELHTANRLLHVTVVEEAHNVVGNVASNTNENASDIQAKAVQAFCNMLAEVRAYGEGLIIADQSPEKLARDAMRNTNVQIAHQLRDSHDREAIANAMIMSDEQRDFLGKCQTGRAAVFYTGLEKATFIDVPVYKDRLPDSSSKIENRWCGFQDNATPLESDREVAQYMGTFKAFDCSLCQKSHLCQHYSWIDQYIQQINPYIPKYIKTQRAKGISAIDALIQLLIYQLKLTKDMPEERLDSICCLIMSVTRIRSDLSNVPQPSQLIERIKIHLV